MRSEKNGKEENAWLIIFANIDKRVVRLLLIVKTWTVYLHLSTWYFEMRGSQSTSKLVATMMMMICEKGKKRCGVHAFSRCIKSTNNIEISRLSATVVYIFVRVETRTFGLLRIGVRNGWQEGHLSYQGTSKIKPSDVYYISKLTRDSVPFLIHPPLFFHLSLSLSFSFNG